MISALAAFLVRVAATASFALLILHVSLIWTSDPLGEYESQKVSAALELLDQRGFHDEAAVIRSRAIFRSTDHWLNRFAGKENAYAATNYPFGIVTIYRDFFEKAIDDTERAAILLHESQHLQGKNESDSYSFVWQSRRQLGWTQLSHGTSATFVAIELATRESAPELFSCSRNLWSDCTEVLRASR